MQLIMNRKKGIDRGITSLEMIVVLAVLVTALTITVPLLLNKNKANREHFTLKRMQRIKTAIVGTGDSSAGSSRAQFGFVGDLGVLPNNLTALIDNSSSTYPSYRLQNKTWFGWRGPYLKTTTVNGNFIELSDAWNNPILYRDPDSDPLTWNAELRSSGPDGVFSYLPNPTDDLWVKIDEYETRSHVEGTFRDIKGDPIDESQISIYFPNGTATLDTLQITTDPVDQTKYSTITDDVPAAYENKRKIPIGIRYIETTDRELKKLAAIMGHKLNPSAGVHFVDNEEITPPEKPFFERNFYATDNTDPENGSPITSLRGNWSNDGSGNFYADGGQQEYRAVFGNPQWEDYRLEVNATLHQGRGYGIYYRSDHQADITGYCFQYDPGLTSGGRVTFVVRKVVNGGEQAPFQRRDMTLPEFPDVYGASHHISITVISNRHIIKVDGNPIFDFTDNDYMMGGPGLRSWDGNHYTDFHSLLVYAIPPLETHEQVWWSFEEGSGTRVYGSGFEIGASEINGTIEDPTEIYRRWENDNIHGQAMYATGSRDGYINFGDVLDFLPNNGFSISAWVKMNSINTANEYVVISKIKQGNKRGWKLSLDRVSSYNFGAKFTFQQTKNSKQLVRLNNLEIEEGKWYHIMVTYDGTIYSGSTLIPPSALNIYVTPHTNTSVQSSPTLITLENDLVSDSSTTSNSNLLMGAEISGSNRFQGFFDEIWIYNRALLLVDINTVFQKEK
jgi:type II secretory pathway pseudopilin PulG